MANTVTYINPAGIVAPTADQNRPHQSMVAEITGDNSATTFTVTHNWGLSTAEQAQKYPYILIVPILAAGITAAAFVASQDANSVVFTNTAFTGKGVRIILLRPWSPER